MIDEAEDCRYHHRPLRVQKAMYIITAILGRHPRDAHLSIGLEVREGVYKGAQSCYS